YDCEVSFFITIVYMCLHVCALINSVLEFQIFPFKSSWYTCELIFPVYSSVSDRQLPKCLTKFSKRRQTCVSLINS
uniref:Uncharacterized protein n=1 Tax=Coturnix japonica TaxID=93934 RepID=A0A8C2STD1_COTJA